MSELALELIREAKEKRLTRLDLGREWLLVELPQELSKLTWLEELTVGNLATGVHISDITLIAGLINLRSLNLVGAQISDIRPLAKLINLKSLKLSSKQINDIRPLAKLINLKSLKLSGKQVNDIRPLAKLMNLKSLTLSGEQVNDIRPLAKLMNLKSLTLSGEQINDIRPLAKLINLKSLTLSGEQINDIIPLAELTNLNSLSLTNGFRKNSIGDIKPLAKLVNLNSLELTRTGIIDITPLADLINLKSLKLYSNPISDITPINGLINLNLLDLGYNNVSSIVPIAGLKNLNSLNLRKNNISDIATVAELKNITSLDLFGNQISNIVPLTILIENGMPVRLKNKAYHQEIIVGDNPLEHPPESIIEQGNQAILDYFRDLEAQGTEKLNEAKLIIVGEPEAGKTSLMKTLLDPEFKLCPDTETTLGITVSEGWEFPHPQKPDTLFTTNIWDFGGQQIQYMTHQFFLTPGAAYVLVSANDRKEPTNFPYWLKIIHLLGEEKGVYSPVLVVLNEKDDKYINKFNFDLKFYQERYPELQITVREVDLSKRDGSYQALRDEIQNMLTQLPHVTHDRPARWNDIRTTLRERAKTDDHITFAQYAEICQQHSVYKESSQLLFSGYLHRLGSLLHFHDDPTLYNFIILNPQWAVDAVYSVLNDNEIARSGGYFSREQVEKIWSAKQDKHGEPRYNHDERLKLLNLMEKENFEICYPLDKQNYIAPQLLDTRQPDYAWDTQDCLKFRFQYKFMPEGILTRLIVRLNTLIEPGKDGQGLVWRKGVIFNSENCRAQVLEEENRDGLKVIDIAVSGYKNQRKFLLRQIRNEVQSIHKKWFRNIQSEQMIPCTCDTCSKTDPPTFFEESELQQYQQESAAYINCRKGRIKQVSVQQLLEGVFDRIELEQQKIARKYGANSSSNIHIHLPKTPVPLVPTTPDESTQEEFHTHSRWKIFGSLVPAFICTVWAATEWTGDIGSMPYEPILGLVVSILAIAGVLFFDSKN